MFTLYFIVPGSMSTPLLLYVFLFPAFCYALPVLDKEQLASLKDEALKETNYPLLDKEKLWEIPEWDTLEHLEEISSRLLRLQRDVSQNLPVPSTFATNTESSSEASSDTTPYIIQESTPIEAVTDEPPSQDLVIENKTSTTISLSTEVNQHLTDNETTPRSNTDPATSLSKHTEWSTPSPKRLSTLSSIVSTEALADITTEGTTLDKILSTERHGTKSTGHKVEDATLTSASKSTEYYLSSDTVTLNNSSNGQDSTTGWLPDPTKSPTSTAMVTNMTETTEQAPPFHSLMKQCMVTVLILAVVCTIFIITTIALAAKLSTLKSQNKHRQAVSYTEMRCISTLMPENNHNNKVNLKKMKTFASNVEDSDGDDNTTLNSFLPDH
ncbi:P-selectin glycoprotein ligand 1 [Pelodytes ibericus]